MKQPNIDAEVCNSVGKRIAAARVAAGLTQKELSDRVSKARATVIQYEQGRFLPSIHMIEEFAEALEVSPESLAFGRNSVSIPEDNAGAEGVSVFGIPHDFAEELGIGKGDRTKIYTLSYPEPDFGYGAGDRIIVRATNGLESYGLHAIRSKDEVVLIESLPTLIPATRSVRVRDGHGQHYQFFKSTKIEVLGKVLGALTKQSW